MQLDCQTTMSEPTTTPPINARLQEATIERWSPSLPPSQLLRMHAALHYHLTDVWAGLNFFLFGVKLELQWQKQGLAESTNLAGRGLRGASRTRKWPLPLLPLPLIISLRLSCPPRTIHPFSSLAVLNSFLFTPRCQWCTAKLYITFVLCT